MVWSRDHAPEASGIIRVVKITSVRLSGNEGVQGSDEMKRAARILNGILKKMGKSFGRGNHVFGRHFCYKRITTECTGKWKW